MFPFLKGWQHSFLQQAGVRVCKGKEPKPQNSAVNELLLNVFN